MTWLLLASISGLLQKDLFKGSESLMANFSNIILLTHLSHKVCLALSSAVLLRKSNTSDNNFIVVKKEFQKLVTLVKLLNDNEVNEVTSHKKYLVFKCCH